MKKYRLWIGAVLILVIGFGTVYIVGQQVQRSDADYPQIQIAEDAAAALDQGVMPSGAARGRVDLRASLAPFTIIYNRSGQVVAGSGYLDGKVPVMPIGVLKAANDKTYNAVTWQPAGGVRIASVSVMADKYYVVSGRSLAEVEKNENRTLELSMAGGVLALIVLAGMFVATRPSKR